MIREFEPVMQELQSLIEKWEPKLLSLPGSLIIENRNSQNRTIKQILGHMIDSASNNTHRFIHLQYQESPFEFPDYASYGNNDRWISIQNYQEEDWQNMVKLWKYSNLHVVHIIKNVNVSKLDNEWLQDKNKTVSLKDLIIDYLWHFKLHLDEIDELTIH